MEKKRYQTRSTYNVINTRLIRDAESGESKSGELEVKLTTAENGMNADFPVFVTWVVRGGELGKIAQLKKGDLLTCSGKPHFRVNDKGTINASCYVHAMAVNYSGSIDDQFRQVQDDVDNAPTGA